MIVQNTEILYRKRKLVYNFFSCATPMKNENLFVYLLGCENLTPYFKFEVVYNIRVFYL